MRYKACNPRVGVAGAVLLAAALFGSTALAQGVSVITGKVSDASTHQAVADVVVTATSPNLQGEQIVVTDATGQYRIPQLPPGVYTIRFEKEGFHPYVREGITLRPDVTIRVDVDLLPEAIQAETVVVVGRPPTVDVGSTTQGADIGQEFINNLALARPGGVGGSSRGFEALALAVPQSTGDSFGVSINGATAPENSYLVDGVSVNNPAYGLNGSSLTVDFLDDVNVITGGYLPEYGRAMGGTISATTKSGGNEFHGSVFLNLAPGALAADPKVPVSAISVISSSAKPYMIGDLGATLGGYILKDKLWFFAGVQPSFSRYKGTWNITPGTDTTPAFSQDRFADQRVFNYIAKLTYLLNPDNRLSLTWNGTYNTSGGDKSFPFGVGADNNDPNAALFGFGGDFGSESSKNTNGANDLTLKWNSSFMNKKVLLDASFGWHHQAVSSLPIDGSDFSTPAGDTTALMNQMGLNWSFLRSFAEFPSSETGIPQSVIDTCLAGGNSGRNLCPSGWRTGGPGFVFDSTLNSYQFKLVGTYFANILGHHTIKAGFDGDLSTYHQIEGYTGQRALSEKTLVDSSGNFVSGGFTQARAFAIFTGPNQYTLTNLDKQTKSLIAGGFLQDSWNILDMVTLNAGIRYDAQTVYNADGDVAMKLNNEWSPRIGLIWDPTQKGKSKIYVNYAKYYEDVPLDLANRALSGESQITFERFRPGAAGCGPGQLTNNCANGVVRPLGSVFGYPPYAGDPNDQYLTYGIAPDTVDSGISPPSSTEIVAGVEYELIESLRASLSYTHRELSGTIEDMSNTNGATFFLGNPGSGAAAAFPKATRIYNAGTIALTKSFSNNWLLQGSYTLSRLHGNYDGLVSRGYGQLDPNITADFDLAPLLVNGNGPLSIDATHSIKLFVAKEFPITGNFSVTLGGSYLAHSGYPTNYLGANANPGYGDNAIYILPRGSGPRLPWYHDIDGHLSVNYRFSKDTELSATLDAFNLFNRRTFDDIDQSYTFYPQGVLPIVNGTPADLPGKVKDDFSGTPIDPSVVNQNFGNPDHFQVPRSVRVGVKLTF